MYFGGDDLVRRQGADAARRIPPVVTGHRLGVAIGGGTDAHRVASYNPFTSLQWFLDGKTVAGTPIRGPEETPDRLTALQLLHARQRLVLVRRRRARLARGRQARRSRRAVGGLPHRAARRGRQHRVGVDAARRRSRLRRRRRSRRSRTEGARHGDRHGARAALPLRHRARRRARRRAEHRQPLLLLLRRLPSVRAFPRPRRRCSRRARRHRDHADVASERRFHGRRRQGRGHAALARKE